MKNAVKQIIGSFEDIGKDIARETIKAPVDIAGKAMESMGASSQGQKGQTKPTAQVPTGGAIGEMDKTNDMNAKRNFARQALAQFAGPRQRQPSVHERFEQEKRQKEEAFKQQQSAAKKNELKPMSFKAKRGNLHGKGGQKANTEMSKNTRQD